MNRLLNKIVIKLLIENCYELKIYFNAIPFAQNELDLVLYRLTLKNSLCSMNIVTRR